MHGMCRTSTPPTKSAEARCPAHLFNLARRARLFYPLMSFSHEGGHVRRLPPLNAIKAFEAAARSESFTRAAEELNVTHGAVSHQVKALEATLGIRLFNRERQRLVITEAGREYLAVVRDALDRIAAGTQRLVERQSSGILTISTSPDFAAKWLVYRLGRFAERHPEIDLRVSATMHHVDLHASNVARHGDGKWTGLEVVRLCSEQLFPVCSPKLVSGRNRMTTAADLFPRCGRRAGHCACTHRPRGLGSSQSACLIRPIDICLRMSNTYWIVCPQVSSSVPKIATFRKWLLAEAAEDARRLEAIGSSHRYERGS